MSSSNDHYILAIESSCDDTGAAILFNDKILANIVADQSVHEKYGGVVPELASRAHQQHIVPVVDAAMKEAGITGAELATIAYTRGPGLLGSLMVGASFAKSMAQALEIPTIPVDHMKAHILAHFIKKDGQEEIPEFPFLSLTVSGGHTQLVEVNGPNDMKILGKTLDDAAGEAFDKAAKMLSLPYPGGPILDKKARGGKVIHSFAEPKVPGLDYSFSGLKTSVLYHLRDRLAEDQNYIGNNLNDLCASVQNSIVNILLTKLKKALQEKSYSSMALAGGVAANSELRERFISLGEERGIKAFIPPFEFCTDNAAMIGIAGHFALKEKVFGSLDMSPKASLPF